MHSNFTLELRLIVLQHCNCFSDLQIEVLVEKKKKQKK